MNLKQFNLDAEESEILQAFEEGKLSSIQNVAQERKKLIEAAESTLKKDKRINIRLPSRVLERIQMQAAREGLPYQTYIASTLYKLASGRLVEG